MLHRRTARPVRSTPGHHVGPLVGRLVGRLVAVTATLTMGLAGVSVAAPSATAASGSCSTVRVAAHRGSHDASHTENTLRSARLAVARGAYAVEGDMQLSKDGVWVLMHDSTVDRTTDGSGRVADLTSSQIQGLHTLDGVAGGVPTVESFLTTMDASPSTKLQLEIKPSSVSSTALRSLMHTFAAHKAASRLMITSFNRGPLAAVRSTYSPAWNTALISTTAVGSAQAKPYGDKVIVEQSAVSSSYVARMHDAGLVVWAWTVDSEPSWQSMARAGANGVVTNKLVDTLGCWG